MAQSFSIYFPRLAGVFFVCFYLAMVYATATLENLVTIQTIDSGGSASSGNNWNCAAKTSKLRSVRFQSVKMNGKIYERTFIDGMSLTGSGGQVIQKTFTAANLGTCLLAAGKAGVDAIGFNNSVCAGYTMKTNWTVCPCSSNTPTLSTLVFVNKNKISASRSIFYDNIGSYTKTVVYSDFVAQLASRRYPLFTAAVCNAQIASGGNIGGQIVSTSGSCYTIPTVFNPNYCTSCTGTPVTVYTLTTIELNSTIFMDDCGATVTISTFNNIQVLSHAGYGCTNYAQPATATDCEMTFIFGTGNSAIYLFLYPNLASSGTTCDDELVVYNGTSSSGVEMQRTCSTDVFEYIETSRLLENKITIVFKRKPPVPGASSPNGFSVKMTNG